MCRHPMVFIAWEELITCCVILSFGGLCVYNGLINGRVGETEKKTSAD